MGSLYSLGHSLSEMNEDGLFSLQKLHAMNFLIGLLHRHKSGDTSVGSRKLHGLGDGGDWQRGGSAISSSSWSMDDEAISNRRAGMRSGFGISLVPLGTQKCVHTHANFGEGFNLIFCCPPSEVLRTQ